MSGGSQYTRVWQIHSLLHPRPDDLISTARFFVREGELYVWNEKKRKKQLRYFYLFNDILLLTKRESHKRFWLRIHITLRSPYVSVEDMDNSSANQEIRLHCRSRSFLLYAPSDELRRDWVDDLRASISGSHKDEIDNKELKKKGDELVTQKNESTGKAIPPTLSQVGKKPRTASVGAGILKNNDSDEEDAPAARKNSKRKPRTQSQAPIYTLPASPSPFGDIIEYPNQPGFGDASIRAGGGFIQSSPGAFNSMNSNPFLASGSGQPANPFAPQPVNNQFLALTSSPGSPFGQPAPAHNPFASAVPQNVFGTPQRTGSVSHASPFSQSSPAVNPFAPSPNQYSSQSSFAGAPQQNPFAPQAQPQTAANPFF
jgi:hypothetical protein